MKVIEETEFDNSTGEILAQKKYIKKDDKRIIPYKERYGFVKSFNHITPKFDRLQEQGAYSILSATIQRYTNMIMVRRKNSSLRPATRKDIQNILCVGEKFVDRFLSEARKKMIIASMRTGNKTHYVINPAYCFNGGGIDPILFNIFIDDKNFVMGLTVKSILRYKKDTGENIMPVLQELHPMIAKNILK